VEETNRDYYQYMDTLGKRLSTLPDVTVQEMRLSLAIVLQMGHNQRDVLKDYWLTLEQLYTTIYRNTVKRKGLCYVISL
jgi:hypothetical protein